jgi:4-amino-4-deoxy-L-arabinose transferase-like glycosyltransferase
MSWEIYPIMLVASFLRLFNIDKVVFGQDEADVYQVARDAVVHTLLPLTSNRASIGALNPPMVVYFLMLPAMFSANPLWGQAFVALLNTLAVLLTYLFTRRYYGRLAGTISSALFATSVSAWLYSRPIWPQNFLPFLVVIFIWLLFRGVVERKKGWFFPAILVLGGLYQLHGSTLYLSLPLGVATVLAFKTIRWREIAYALIGLLLIFAPFIIWEFHNGFSDLKVTLATAQAEVVYDTAALNRYLFFIHPTLINPYTTFIEKMRDNHLILPNARSILLATPLRYAKPLLEGDYGLALIFLVGGMFVAAAQVFLPQSTGTAGEIRKKRLRRWWADFQATPSRQGLLILLIWQIAPLLLFIRHSIVLFDHYFIFLLPGQFIFMALFVTQMAELLQRQRLTWERWWRYGMSALAVLMILAQLIGAGSTLIDLTSGNFNETSTNPFYVELASEQNALQAADQLAQQRGIHRISIPANAGTAMQLAYLSQQLKIQVQVNIVDNNGMIVRCMVLPDLSAGPVVMLVEPDVETSLVLELIKQYAQATLVGKPHILGGNHYQLYVLTAKPAPVSRNFTQGLHLLTPSAAFMPTLSQIITRWQITDTQAQKSRTLYHYNFQLQASSGTASFDCASTSTWAGDQLFLVQKFSPQSAIPAQVSIKVQTFTSQPDLTQVGPLALTSFYGVNGPARQLLTEDRQSTLTLPVQTIVGT